MYSLYHKQDNIISKDKEFFTPCNTCMQKGAKALTTVINFKHSLVNMSGFIRECTPYSKKTSKQHFITFVINIHDYMFSTKHEMFSFLFLPTEVSLESLRSTLIHSDLLSSSGSNLKFCVYNSQLRYILLSNKQWTS